MRILLSSTFFILFVIPPLIAQEVVPSEQAKITYYNKAVRMKNGAVIIGQVQYDRETDRYEIKPENGGIITVLGRDVLVVEHHARTFLPPRYYGGICPDCIQPCDSRQREKQWYFAELRGWGMYNGKDNSKYNIGLGDFTPGGEGTLGVRFNKLGIGIGSSFFQEKGIQRIPAFLHFRYNITRYCFSPFLYAQLGTVFDNQSGEKISKDRIFHPGPKIAGVGIGIDYALLSWFDLSADIGYRYMQLPTKKDCDCSDVPEPKEAVFHNETHSVILRLGVTF